MFNYEDGCSFFDQAGLGHMESDTFLPYSLNNPSVSLQPEFGEVIPIPPVQENPYEPFFFGMVPVNQYHDPIGTLSLERELSLTGRSRSNSIVLPSFSRQSSFGDQQGFNSFDAPSVQMCFVPFENQQFPEAGNTEVIPTEVGNDSTESVATDVNDYSETAFTDTVNDGSETVLDVLEPAKDSHQTFEEKTPLVEFDSMDMDWMESTSSGTTKAKGNTWTREECDRLREGVRLYGSMKAWKLIAKHVGNRCSSQCINKWKNSLSKEKHKWTGAATKTLEKYVSKGLSIQAILEKMPEYTYIQVYQHIQKLKANHEPWQEWEIQKLIQLKLEGTLHDTDIGRHLNNRHRDDVKNKWNRLKREYGY